MRKLLMLFTIAGVFWSPAFFPREPFQAHAQANPGWYNDAVAGFLVGSWICKGNCSSPEATIALGPLLVAYLANYHTISQSSAFYVQAESTIVATQWNIVGSINQDSCVITWENGAVWTRTDNRCAAYR